MCTKNTAIPAGPPPKLPPIGSRIVVVHDYRAVWCNVTVHVINSFFFAVELHISRCRQSFVWTTLTGTHALRFPRKMRWFSHGRARVCVCVCVKETDVCAGEDGQRDTGEDSKRRSMRGRERRRVSMGFVAHHVVGSFWLPAGFAGSVNRINLCDATYRRVRTTGREEGGGLERGWKITSYRENENLRHRLEKGPLNETNYEHRVLTNGTSGSFGENGLTSVITVINAVLFLLPFFRKYSRRQASNSSLLSCRCNYWKIIKPHHRPGAHNSTRVQSRCRVYGCPATRPIQDHVNVSATWSNLLPTFWDTWLFFFRISSYTIAC